MTHLLAIDLGLRAGLALYNQTGQLVWYRSKNFGRKGSMRRAIPSIFEEISDLRYLVVEGGGDLAEIWEQAAYRWEIEIYQLSAEVWREALLLPRQQRNGTQAKYYADQLARRIIAQADLPRPTSLRHDAAEAILIGLWGVVKVGWLDEAKLQSF